MSSWPSVVVESGVAGFIVPDLPYEESAPLRAALEPRGLALVQLVSPGHTTGAPQNALRGQRRFCLCRDRHRCDRWRRPCRSRGHFCLSRRIRAVSPLPVCAGFGIRDASQVAAFGHTPTASSSARHSSKCWRTAAMPERSCSPCASIPNLQREPFAEFRPFRLPSGVTSASSALLPPGGGLGRGGPPRKNPIVNPLPNPSRDGNFHHTPSIKPHPTDDHRL